MVRLLPRFKRAALVGRRWCFRLPPPRLEGFSRVGGFPFSFPQKYWFCGYWKRIFCLEVGFQQENGVNVENRRSLTNGVPHPPPSGVPDHRRGKTIPGHYSCPPIVPHLLTVGPSRLPVANRARQPGPFLEIRSLLLPQAALHGFPRKRLASSATGGASPLSPPGEGFSVV